MKKLFWIVNLPRTLLIYLLTKNSRQRALIFKAVSYTHLDVYKRQLIMIPYIVPLIQNIGIEIQRAKNMHKFRSIIYFVIALANLGISIPVSYTHLDVYKRQRLY